MCYFLWVSHFLYCNVFASDLVILCVPKPENLKHPEYSPSVCFALALVLPSQTFNCFAGFDSECLSWGTTVTSSIFTFSGSGVGERLSLSLGSGTALLGFYFTLSLPFFEGSVFPFHNTPWIVFQSYFFFLSILKTSTTWESAFVTKNIYLERATFVFSCWHPLLGERSKRCLNLFQLSSRYSTSKIRGL